MNSVVSVAKEQIVNADEQTLSTGVRVRINPVSARLLTESMARVPKPKVPVYFDEDRQREFTNPSDPVYLDELAERDSQQTNVAMDALIMFGIELVDGIPDDGWDKKLKLLEKLNQLDLEGYDLDNELEREFVYKKFVAVSAGDMDLLQQASGVVTEEDLDQAEESFPGGEAPDPDKESEGEGG